MAIRRFEEEEITNNSKLTFEEKDLPWLNYVNDASKYRKIT